jgi:hypothetical protein
MLYFFNAASKAAAIVKTRKQSSFGAIRSPFEGISKCSSEDENLPHLGIPFWAFTGTSTDEATEPNKDMTDLALGSYVM